MARTRHARWKVREGEERVTEYQMALENKDRPQWSPEKIKEMVNNARDVFSSIAELDARTRQVAATFGIPTFKRIDLYRIVRRAWRLARADTPMDQYCSEIAFMAAKYGFDMATINMVLLSLGLPPCPGYRTFTIAPGGRPVMPAF